ncbi:MAG TPA: YfhO family protein [Thermoanaerobaculia bacterium]|nr:YfhO family protein [Thermoanaerobaculia bacterium]
MALVNLVAPILAYAAFGILALGLAHRFVLPLSRLAAIALLLLPLAFTGRALLTGRVYAPIDLPYQAHPLAALKDDYGVRFHNPAFSDVYCLNIPWKKATRISWSRGELPLWNPFLFAGDIHAAAAQTTPYEPLFLASLLLPMHVSLTFLAAMTFLLAGLSMYLYCRDLGCRDAASLFGAAAWMFGSFLVFWLEWVITASTLWFPLVLLGVRRTIHHRSPRSVFLLTAAFSMTLLSGHPESLFHIVVLGIAYALFELALLRPKLPELIRTALAGIAAGAIALLLCAIYLLPILEALPQTFEHWFRQVVVRNDRPLPMSESLAALRINFVPFIHGSPDAEQPDPPPSIPSHSSAYPGSLLFAPALYGLIRTRWKGRWLLTGFLLFGWLAGAQAPVVTTILGRIPLFDIAINNRLVFAALFALAALAALGVEAWLERGRPVAMPLLLISSSVLFAIATAVLWPAMRAELSARYLTAESVKLILPPLLCGLALLPARGRAIGAAVLLVLLVAQRTAEMGSYYPTLPARMFYPPIPGFEAFPRGDDPYRIVGHEFTFIPNTATMYELEDARGYTAMTFRRHADLFPLWSVPQAVWFNRVDDLSRPFLSFLNVRYAITRPGAGITAGWRVVLSNEAMTLLENTRALPRAFVPQRVRINQPPEDVIRQMSAAIDFGERAWIDHPTGGGPADEIDNGPGTVSIRTASLRERRLDVEMKGEGWVVVSEANWKGWRAYRENRRIPIRFANHAYIGFHLPAGRHRVRLVYFPSSFRAGAIISLLTATGLTAYGISRRMRLA